MSRLLVDGTHHAHKPAFAGIRREAAAAAARKEKGAGGAGGRREGGGGRGGGTGPGCLQEGVGARYAAHGALDPDS